MFSIRFICVLVDLVIAEVIVLCSAVAIAHLLTSSYALADRKLFEKIFIYEIVKLMRANLVYVYLV